MSFWSQFKKFFTEGAPTGNNEPTCEKEEDTKKCKLKQTKKTKVEK